MTSQTEALIKARRKFLHETIQHFNLGNRSTGTRASGHTTQCLYSGTGCAIGRHIADKALCSKLDGMLHSGCDSPLVFDMLPADLQALGRHFLSEVQNLHDTEKFWTPTGLNAAGLKAAEQIRHKWIPKDL